MVASKQTLSRWIISVIKDIILRESPNRNPDSQGLTSDLRSQVVALALYIGSSIQDIILVLHLQPRIDSDEPNTQEEPSHHLGGFLYSKFLYHFDNGKGDNFCSWRCSASSSEILVFNTPF